jgi:hypothetical protein
MPPPMDESKGIMCEDNPWIEDATPQDLVSARRFFVEAGFTFFFVRATDRRKLLRTRPNDVDCFLEKGARTVSDTYVRSLRPIYEGSKEFCDSDEKIDDSFAERRSANPKIT